MMFMKKGYCRCDGKMCRHLRVEDGIGLCVHPKARFVNIIRNPKTGKPKNFRVQKNTPISDIKAPLDCPKI